MPNWCSNRMHFSGEPAQIAEIKRLASGAVTPFYRRATNEGIQLFLAGSAGLLQTTEDVWFEPCPVRIFMKGDHSITSIEIG